MKGLLILLAILKGIGIVLLALLLLLLLLVLVVLFSPIRYRLEGEKKTELGASFGVSWLFGAVQIEGSYTAAESLQYKVKALWRTIIGEEPKKEPKKEKKAKKKKAASKTEEQKPDLQAAEKTEPQQPESPAEVAKAKQRTEPPKPPEPQIEQQRMEQMQPKTVRRVKLSQIVERPPEQEMQEEPFSLEEEDFFTGEEQKKKEKIPPILKELWSIEEKKEICKAFGKLLKRLMKGILPGDLFLKATLGTGDPPTTGYVLALAGVLTAKFGNAIQIKGDFTQATAEDIELRLKGKIRLGQLLWALLAFVWKKPVRKAIRKMLRFLRKKDG